VVTARSRLATLVSSLRIVSRNSAASFSSPMPSAALFALILYILIMKLPMIAASGISTQMFPGLNRPYMIDQYR